jgi:hypothetical protein
VIQHVVEINLIRRCQSKFRLGFLCVLCVLYVLCGGSAMLFAQTVALTRRTELCHSIFRERRNLRNELVLQLRGHATSLSAWRDLRSTLPFACRLAPVRHRCTQMGIARSQVLDLATYLIEIKPNHGGLRAFDLSLQRSRTRLRFHFLSKVSVFTHLALDFPAMNEVVRQRSMHLSQRGRRG